MKNLDASSVFLPHYIRKKKCWEVKFPSRATETGSISYVASEYVWDGLIYEYEADGNRNHEHSFEALLVNIIQDVKQGKSISFIGYEEEYSAQELLFLKKLITKMEIDMHGVAVSF